MISEDGRGLTEESMAQQTSHIFTLQEAAMGYVLSAESIFGDDVNFLNSNPSVIPIFVSQMFQSLEISIKYAGIWSVRIRGGYRALAVLEEDV
jgi:hypothetical protein